MRSIKKNSTTYKLKPAAYLLRGEVFRPTEGNPYQAGSRTWDKVIYNNACKDGKMVTIQGDIRVLSLPKYYPCYVIKE